MIDADALLKKFNDTGIHITFDLPVEEILGEDVDIDDFTMLVQDVIQAYKEMVIDVIKEQPTAYDVEKVVEELEERKQLHNDMIAYEQKNGTVTEKYQARKAVEVLDKAIEIVRKGGAE